MGARPRTGELPEAEWRKILYRYLDGESADDIARDLGCPTVAVTRVLRRLFRDFQPQGDIADAPAADRASRPQLARAMIRFLVALDGARNEADAAAIQALSRSSDQLMRAIARVRLELVHGAGARDG